MDEFKIILEEKQTVMARYEVEPKPGEGYQSEAQLERALIKQLADQGYEYAKIKDEAALLENLRRQLQVLNDITLSDSEWARLLPMISNEQMTILDKTEMLQGKGWRAFRICAERDFSLIGILARISKVLADVGIGIFAIST